MIPLFSPTWSEESIMNEIRTPSNAGHSNSGHSDPGSSDTVSGNSVATESHLKESFPELMRRWRRLRKCSQLDLSVDAEISQRHLSFMESGRSKPSRDMVLRLADALDLPLRERNVLLASAGFAPAFQQRMLNSEDMDALMNAVKMQLAFHEPFPAVVVDRNWNLVLRNQAATRMMALLGDMDERWQRIDPSGDRNIYRMTFDENGLRPFIENWETLLKVMLIRLQREVEADPFNGTLSRLLEDLMAQAGTSYAGLAALDVSTLAPVIPMTIRVGDVRLSLVSMIAGFGSAIDVTAEELKVESFFPADKETEAFFRQCPPTL